MIEIWKKIDKFDYYEISNLGNVKSILRNVTNVNGVTKISKCRLLKCIRYSNPYISVMLYQDGKRYHKLIHRLVAEAFIPNPNRYTCVNHKDENKTNNGIDNLEWCNHKYNNNYGTAVVRRSEKRMVPIIQRSLNGTFIQEWLGASTAARELKLHKSNILLCCQNRRRTTGGYKWEYK